MRKRNRFLPLALFGLFAFFQALLYGGSVGGGGIPPSLETSLDTMTLMKSGAVNGDLIRLTTPGHDPVLLRPNLASIKERSLSAQSLSTDDSTIFYTASPVQKVQTTMSLNLIRNMMAAAGTLPIIPSEDLVIKPQIELVKQAEVNGENLDSAGQ